MRVSDSLAPSIADLRAHVAAIAAPGRPALATGVAEMDGRLGHGGIATDAVHEVAAVSPSLSDDAAATLFVAGLAARLTRTREGGQALWALTRFDLYAPGLEQAGLAANMLLFAQGKDDAEVLAVAEDEAGALLRFDD